MKRIRANNQRLSGYSSLEAENAISHIQTAETLEEINQKTLTIRDQFAIAAMQSLTSVYWTVDDQYESGKALIKCQAETAYEMADAMLEARNK